MHSGSVSALADTRVNVMLDGNQTPMLKINNPISKPLKVSQVPLRLSGEFNALLQLRVYIDGTLSQIVPLSSEVSTFSYDMSVGPGRHVVEIVGVSTFSTQSPSVSFIVNYLPELAMEPGEPPETAQPLLGLLARTSYEALVALNVVNTHDVKKTAPMIWRVVTFIIGLVLLLFPDALIMFSRRLWRLVFGHVAALSTTRLGGLRLTLRVIGALLVVVVLALP